MIRDFLQSWPLFQDAYLTAALAAMLLSIVGVIVVARDQIFLGAAAAQASTLGIAIALWAAVLPSLENIPVVGSMVGTEAFPVVMAAMFAIAATLLMAMGGGKGQQTFESLTGWVFLAAGSLAVLVVAHSPHGLDEVQRLVASSVIGATRVDVYVLAAMLVVTAIAVALKRRGLILW